MWETLLTRAAAPSQTHRIDLNSYFSSLESVMLLKSRLIKEYSYSKIELPSLSNEWSIGISNFVDFFQPFQSFSPAPLGSLSLYAWIYLCFVSTVFLNHKLLIFFLRSLLYIPMLNTITWRTWWSRDACMHIPFLWQFYLCNITQAVVD